MTAAEVFVTDDKSPCMLNDTTCVRDYVPTAVTFT